MKYKILKDGVEINTIVSDEAFCQSYCTANGYTYEAVPDPDPTPDPELDDYLSVSELAQALKEGVNDV